jgi:hypothetical protein
VNNPDWDALLSGRVTRVMIERLFHYPAIHFKSHAEQIRQGLENELSPTLR